MIKAGGGPGTSCVAAIALSRSGYMVAGFTGCGAAIVTSRAVGYTIVIEIGRCPTISRMTTITLCCGLNVVTGFPGSLRTIMTAATGAANICMIYIGRNPATG